MDRNYRS